jgi:hypothetical protein
VLARYELREGLVLRLDPRRLLELGSDATGPGRYRASGPHYFICVGVSADLSDWVATSSKWERDRLWVRRKWGDPDWVRSETYADPFQVWTVSYVHLLRASLGADRTRAGHRNYASLQFLDDLAMAA